MDPSKRDGLTLLGCRIRKASREANLPENIMSKLPKIVAIGGQSAGKSTFMVAMCGGHEILPTGHGLCTRCPTILQFRQLQHEQTGSGDTANNAGASEGEFYVEFSHLPGKKFTDCKKIREQIEEKSKQNVREANEKRARDDNEAASSGGSSDKPATKEMKVVKTPVELTVYSTDTIDLTLVDMPGIVASCGEGPEVPLEVEQLNREEIQDENCIILAVRMATEDPATSRVWNLVTEVDKKHERTVGVLTQADLVSHSVGDSDKLINALSGEDDYKLKLGYYAVAANKSSEEEKCFDNIFKNLERKRNEETKDEGGMGEEKIVAMRSRCGVTATREFLREVLKDKLRQKIPEFKHDLRRKIRDCDATLRDLAPEQEKSPEIIAEHIERFGRKVQDWLQGHYFSEVELKASALVTQLFFGYESTLEKWNPRTTISNDDLEVAMSNGRGLHPKECPSAPVLMKIIERVCEPLLDHSIETLDKVEKVLEETLEEACPKEMELVNNLRTTIRNSARQFLYAQAEGARKRIEDKYTEQVESPPHCAGCIHMMCGCATRKIGIVVQLDDQKKNLSVIEAPIEKNDVVIKSEREMGDETFSADKPDTVKEWLAQHALLISYYLTQPVVQCMKRWVVAPLEKDLVKHLRKEILYPDGKNCIPNERVEELLADDPKLDEKRKKTKTLRGHYVEALKIISEEDLRG